MTRFALYAVVLAPLSALANGGWTIGGRVGVNQNGSSVAPTAAVTAEYTINSRLTWRTDAEVQVADLAHPDVFSASVPTQLLLHPMGSNALLDPYLGPGLSASLVSSQTTSLGAHALAGVALHPKSGQTFGLEVKWGVSDMISNPAPTWSMALTGNWNYQLGKH